MPVVPSAGMMAASRSINVIGAGVPMASRSAATMARECGSPSHSIAVTGKPSTPEIGWPVPEMLAKIKLLHSELDIAPSTKDYMSRQEFIFATAELMKRKFGITVLDPSVVLRATDKCVLEIAGKPLYRDDHHLSGFGAMQLVPLLSSVM